VGGAMKGSADLPLLRRFKTIQNMATRRTSGNSPLGRVATCREARACQGAFADFLGGCTSTAGACRDWSRQVKACRAQARRAMTGGRWEGNGNRRFRLRGLV
jgi:hypothetical protein